MTAAMDGEWNAHRQLVAAFYDSATNKAVLFFRNVPDFVEPRK